MKKTTDSNAAPPARAGTLSRASLLHQAVGLLAQGRFERALRVAEQGLALDPNNGDFHNLAGVCSMELGKRSEAEQYLRRAIVLNPRDASAHSNLGALLDTSAPGEAERFYREAIAFDPDYADAIFNLGNLLKRSKKDEEAEQCYRRATAIDPNHSEARSNLGNLLAERNPQEAELCYRRAIALDPRNSQAQSNLGSLLSDAGQFDEAERWFRRAVSTNPGFAGAFYNLGLLLKNAKRYHEAEAAFRSVLKIDPNDGEPLVDLIHVASRAYSWSRIDQDRSTLLAHAKRDEAFSTNPFPLLAIDGFGPLELKRIARRHAEKEFGAELATAPLVPIGAHYNHGKLRLGYLSADFHEHATMHLLAGVLESHDPARFAVHGYSYGPEVQDTARRRVQNACEIFRDLRALSDEVAARQIAADEVDILIDLKGFTKDCRPEILALRPAPMIVSWLGYPGTLGHPRLADYVIGDRTVTPLHHAEHFSECLALMPHCYQPNDRGRTIGPRPTREQVGLPDSGFVFCSFNQGFKLSPEVFDVWCRLLEAVDTSVLWLLEPDDGAVANLRREAAARKINPTRLVFASQKPLTEHLGRLQLADLALDTYPCTSHTTGSDALWAGVPLITRIGDTFAGRVAASLLHAAGLSDMVVETWDAYFELARKLALDPEALHVARGRIAAQRLTAPLFDTARFTCDLEELYGRIRIQHDRGDRAPVVL